MVKITDKNGKSLIRIVKFDKNSKNHRNINFVIANIEIVNTLIVKITNNNNNKINDAKITENIEHTNNMDKKQK